MHFSQKALIYNRADFEFGERELGVSIDDGRLKIGFTVPYHEIGTSRSIMSFSEKVWQYLGLAVLAAVVVSCYLISEDMTGNDGSVLVLCMVAGLGMYFASRYATFDATRIPIPSGNTILVFHDDRRQTILGEIYKRRKSELLRLYGEVDMLNHPQQELKKFLWLKEEGVISEQQLEAAREKIEKISKIRCVRS
jgi:hypothetical protein